MYSLLKLKQNLSLTASIVILTITLLGFQGEWFFFFDLFSHFRIYLATFSLLIVFIAIFLANRLSIYASIISLLINTASIIPFLVPLLTPVEDTEFKIITVNLWVYNPVKSPAIQFLRTSDADVIVLNEVSSNWKPFVKTLKDIYPYQYFRTDCMERGHCQMALLSKKPWSELTSSNNDANIPTFIMARFLHKGSNLTVLGTHLIYPLEKGTAELQMRQINSISKIVNDVKGALILTGDFNFSPWSFLHRRLINGTELERAEGGILASWISRSLPIRLPIDHTYFRSNRGSARMELGPNIGSDHLPIITDINLSD